MSILLGEQSWPQMQALANDQTVVIVPTAAVEQHGRHMPLNVDCTLVESVATRSAERVRSQIPVLVAPVVSYGVSGYHMQYPGTMTLSMATFMNVVEELCASLIHHGFRRILLLNGHGGNDDPLKIAIRNIADTTGVAVAAASYWDIAGAGLAPFKDVEVDYVPGHACGFETACMLALKPELVDRQAIEAALGTPSDDDGDIRINDVGSRLPKQISTWGGHGWRGNPAQGSAENGEKYLQVIAEHVGDFLVQFANIDIPSVPGSFDHGRVNVS
jgi:creatinine amidohydrolase